MFDRSLNPLVLNKSTITTITLLPPSVICQLFYSPWSWPYVHFFYFSYEIFIAIRYFPSPCFNCWRCVITSRVNALHCGGSYCSVVARDDWSYQTMPLWFRRSSHRADLGMRFFWAYGQQCSTHRNPSLCRSGLYSLFLIWTKLKDCRSRTIYFPGVRNYFRLS